MTLGEAYDHVLGAARAWQTNLEVRAETIPNNEAVVKLTEDVLTELKEAIAIVSRVSQRRRKVD